MGNATAKYVNDCRSLNFKRLYKYLSEHPDACVVLFVGAGINSGLVPTWKTLLNELIETALKQQFKKLGLKEIDLFHRWVCNELDVYDRATLIRRLLGKQYLHHLHRALYRGVKQPPEKTHGTLPIVAELCLAKRVQAVVTYNYDDLLEFVINHLAKKYYAVPVHGKCQIHIPANQLPVYHVHGYLPWKKEIGINDDPQVVLDRYEYYDQMMEPYSWQATVQLDFLRNYVCIYLGTSMTDMNMLRLVHHALQYVTTPHIYVIDAESFYFSRMEEKNKYTAEDRRNTEAKKHLLRLQATLLDEVSIRMVLAENDYEYRSFLNMLARIVKEP